MFMTLHSVRPRWRLKQHVVCYLLTLSMRPAQEMDSVQVAAEELFPR